MLRKLTLLGGGFLMALGPVGASRATVNPTMEDREVVQEPGDSIIYGVVSHIGEPTRDARIVLSRLGGTVDPLYRTVTDYEGRYHFPTLEPGRYLLQVSGTGRDRWNPEKTVDVLYERQEVNFVLDEARIIIQDLGEDELPRYRLSVSPDPLFIVPSQTIEWTVWEQGTDGPGDLRLNGSIPFAVHFSPWSPLTYRRLSAELEEDGGEYLSIIGQVRTTLLPGKYSYFVAVFKDGLVITEDPELIDENGDDPGRRPGGDYP